MVTTVVCSLLGVAAVITNYRTIIVTQSGLVFLSIVMFVLTVANWSGGDDGPGMILIALVGPALLLGAITAIALTILAISNDPRYL